MQAGGHLTPTVAVYSGTHAEHINTPCEQNVGSVNVKTSGIYSYHRAVKG
jgi:hypothetical protein